MLSQMLYGLTGGILIALEIKYVSLSCLRTVSWTGTERIRLALFYISTNPTKRSAQVHLPVLSDSLSPSAVFSALPICSY